MPEGDWFIEKDWNLTVCYKLACLFLYLVLALVFFSLAYGMAEYLAPGFSKFGPYETQEILILAGTATVGAKLLLNYIASFGKL